MERYFNVSGPDAPKSFLLSVVIPVYNEERTLAKLVDAVRAVPVRKQIVLVDDCSKDGSRAVMETFTDDERNTFVKLHHDVNRVLYYWHSVGNKFLTTISNWFTNLNLTDMETCYKVFRTPVLKEILPSLQQDRFGFEPDITSRVARAGLRIYEVGISYNGRTYKEGKHIGWKDGFRAIWCILKYR